MTYREPNRELDPANEAGPETPPPWPRHRFEAVILDLDGVVTRTARLHAEAWKETFDAFLGEHAGDQPPFDIARDYPSQIDGVPRYDGVRAFLAARDIELPEGDDADPAPDTVRGLGDRKDRRFQELLGTRGVETYDDTVEQIQAWRRDGIALALITSSRNGRAVLRAAGADGWFDAVIDGADAERLGIPGKPAPDVFLEAARRLGVEPRAAVVVEDAAAGVRAAREGGFGLVVGADRGGRGATLEEAGADVVVDDLRLVRLQGPDRRLPSALERRHEIEARLGERPPAVFLDYDGTLTPIVRRPELAILSDGMRDTVRRLAARCTVAVISGRDRSDVEDLVGLDELVYGGSHGFDIAGPGGLRMEHEQGRRYLPLLDTAEATLRERLGPVRGVQVERKRFSIAVHYRLVDRGEVHRVRREVDEVVAEADDLRRGDGKEVFEVGLDLPWDKGRAVEWLLEALEVGDEVLPIYVGDDRTDEDAFRALVGRGIGIRVGTPEEETHAAYQLADPARVQRFLDWLAGEAGERR